MTTGGVVRHFGFMRYAYPLTAFGAACRRCLRPPLPRDCANKKLPVASFYVQSNKPY